MNGPIFVCGIVCGVFVMLPFYYVNLKRFRASMLAQTEATKNEMLDSCQRYSDDLLKRFQDRSRELLSHARGVIPRDREDELRRRWGLS